MGNTKEEINASIGNLKKLKKFVCEPFRTSIKIAVEEMEGLLCPSCGEKDDQCICDMEA